MVALEQAGKAITAYFASWSIYGRGYHIWDIDATKLSHINYAFADIQDGLVVLGDPYADAQKIFAGRGDSVSDPEDVLHGNLHQLFRLKQKYRHVKTGLSVGGWSWSGNFSLVAESERGRKRFVASAVQALQDYGLDYIDLDWEYPGGGGLPGNAVSPNDPSNFVLLLEEFQTQFAQHYPDPKDRPYVTIAAACSANVYTRYRLKEMAPLLKYINLMCYDFAGPWSPVAEHQANLYPRQKNGVHSADEAIKYFVQAGVPAGKLVLGVPFYGREFSLCPGLLHPFHGTGVGSWEAGVYDYKDLVGKTGYRSFWERSTNSTYLYSQTGRSLISYDDHRSVAYKMEYVRRAALGGAMLWEISGDREAKEETSLLQVMHQWLGGTRLDRTPNRLCYPQSRFRNIKYNVYCPATVKEDVEEPGRADGGAVERLARIAEYCWEQVVEGGGGGVKRERAHAVPDVVERLKACYQRLVSSPDLQSILNLL